MPVNALRSSNCASTGLPICRFEPPPTGSSGRSAPAMIAATSAASRGTRRALSAPVFMRSESRQMRETLRAHVDVLAALLGAASQRREYFARVEAHLGIERMLDAMLDLEVRRIELVRHEVALLEADTVLTRQHAADVDAQLQDLEAERFGALELTWNVGVVKDQRMQVAVAGVENVRDAEAIPLLHLDHGTQNARQLAPGNRAVHAVVVGAQAAYGRKRRLPPRPKCEPLALARRDANAARRVAGRDLTHPLEEVVDFDGGTVELDDQQRLDVERIADVHERFRGMNRGLVHHLHAGRDDAGGNDRRNAGARRFDVVEADQERARRLRP